MLVGEALLSGWVRWDLKPNRAGGPRMRSRVVLRTIDGYRAHWAPFPCVRERAFLSHGTNVAGRQEEVGIGEISCHNTSKSLSCPLIPVLDSRLLEAGAAHWYSVR